MTMQSGPLPGTQHAVQLVAQGEAALNTAKPALRIYAWQPGIGPR